jgi:hypothetical protein
VAKASPFEYWKVINGQSKYSEALQQSFVSDYDIFMINRIVSHDPKLLKFFFEQPASESLPKAVHFELLRDFYKKTYGNKSIYIDYFKKDATDADIELISNHYNVSTADAVNYREMISDEELDRLRGIVSEVEQSMNTKIKITKKKTTKKGT